MGADLSGNSGAHGAKTIAAVNDYIKVPFFGQVN
jgi:hypothetical protein